jgi:hypothetical protein
MSRKRERRAADQARAIATEVAKELESRDPVTALVAYDFDRKPAATWQALVVASD